MATARGISIPNVAVPVLLFYGAFFQAQWPLLELKLTSIQVDYSSPL
jgi:hypothetical protein